MFGYINVNRKELSPEDDRTYQAYYCGLCRRLKEEAGVKGQMLLNYDMTFLILLLTGLYELKNRQVSFVCALHPAGKKTGYLNAATEYAAAMDIVLSYHNMLDDYGDEGRYSRKAMASVFRRDYERIGRQYPRQVQAVEEYMARLADAEGRWERNIDTVSGYTGQMLATLFAWREDEWTKELQNLGFYMGKFIYLLDAYEDRPQDEKKGRYNPLSFVKLEDGKEYESFCKLTLTSLMAECAKSFERMPILQHAEILRNILYSGVWTRYDYLQLKGQKKGGEAHRKGKTKT